MGQKVHPKGFRLGIYQDWNSRWIADKEYAQLLHEDIKLRKYFGKALDFAGISKIEIERPALKNVKINIHTARPGLVIGKKGMGIEGLKKNIQKMVKKEVFVNIKEVRRPDLDSQLVAENIAIQLKRRVAFRRAMKKAVQAAMRLGADGIKIQCSGRLGGAEMARREWYREGRVPLHTLKSDIDYGFAESKTTYGIIGVKVWICKGDLTEKKHEN
ncbi:MAG: 30S ribosomal protein S3 [Pseudomonadota bacterium]